MNSGIYLNFTDEIQSICRISKPITHDLALFSITKRTYDCFEVFGRLEEAVEDRLVEGSEGANTRLILNEEIKE